MREKMKISDFQFECVCDKKSSVIYMHEPTTHVGDYVLLTNTRQNRNVITRIIQETSYGSADKIYAGHHFKNDIVESAKSSYMREISSLFSCCDNVYEIVAVPFVLSNEKDYALVPLTLIVERSIYRIAKINYKKKFMKKTFDEETEKEFMKYLNVMETIIAYTFDMIDKDGLIKRINNLDPCEDTYLLTSLFADYNEKPVLSDYQKSLANEIYVGFHKAKEYFGFGDEAEIIRIANELKAVPQMIRTEKKSAN